MRNASFITTNMCIRQFGEHIGSLDTKLDELILLVNKLSTQLNSSNIASTSKSVKENEESIFTAPCIQPPLEIEGFTTTSSTSWERLEILFDKKFKGLNIQPLNMDLENIQTIESNFADNIASTNDPGEVLSSELNKLRGLMRNQPGKKYADIPDKLLRIDPHTKMPYGHEQREEIKQKISEYEAAPKKSILIEDKSINYVSRRISAHDGNKLQMIEDYLAEMRSQLLLKVEQASDTSMNSTERSC